MSNDAGRLVIVRAAGLSYKGVVYWAQDSRGVPSVVVALPMGDLDSQAAIAQMEHPDATAEEMLDWLVQRIGEHGCEVLPAPQEPAKARVN